MKSIQYKLQVKAPAIDGVLEWRDVQPCNGQPYLYDEKRRAVNVLNMAYPNLSWELDKRIVEIERADNEETKN
jgi:hypothetical protein